MSKSTMWFLVFAGIALGAVVGIYLYGARLRKKGILVD